MERRIVESSNLASIGYDASTGTLEIEFKSGSIWQYYDFPEHMWNEFEYAESHGKYFNANIKNQYRDGRVG
jgi:KTSC domain